MSPSVCVSPSTTSRSCTVLRLLACLTLLVAGCGYGHSVKMGADDSRAMVVNLGKNRYIYSISRLENLPKRETRALPTVSVAPQGAREIGIIAVSAEHSGFGTEGLRKTEVQFYSELGGLAATLGGQHFHVSDKSLLHGYIVGLTVSVLATSN